MTIEVKVPDIGDFQDIPVIEVFVKPGDKVAAEDPLVTLESDKATMDVPAPAAGVVRKVGVKVGDKVSEGSTLLELDDGAGAQAGGDARAEPAAAAARPATASSRPATATPPPTPEPVTPAPRGEKGRADMPGEGASATPPAGATVEVQVPDIGDFQDVPIIEVFVKPGDIVKPDDPLVTLESDKATMDVPAPIGGVVEGVRVAVGERVRKGSVLLSMKTAQTGAEPASRATPPSQPDNKDAAIPAIGAGSGAPSPARMPLQPPAGAPAPAPAPASTGVPQAAEERAPDMPHETAPPVRAPEAPPDAAGRAAHASPSVRKFARELGVDVTRVPGSGPKGRVLHEDVQNYVKHALAAPAPAAAGAGGVTGAGLDLLPWPKVDFAKFGPVEAKPLSRIRKISGANLARNWVMIPHVTQFDEADVTGLEALRVALNKEHEKAGIKVTMLAFLIKASVAALQKFPDFNASLDGESLVYKRYFNIGFAADTPNGLVVPVVKDADRKGVLDLAQEMADLSKKAREGKLSPADMQGGCFSISSLGGIGGTAFTPIINAPEVAILGVSRTAHKPVWNGSGFEPKLMLPLSLSYDHRVIDGAQAARFITYFSGLLADLRRALL